MEYQRIGEFKMSKVTEQILIQHLVKALLDLKNNECWCEVGIGNPMFSKHTKACKQAAEACKAYAIYKELE